MAFVQLDQAARTVGKSEVTVRRLVKSGKIDHRKQKTLTGFIYLVDPEEIRSYYEGRGERVEAAEEVAVPVESVEDSASAEDRGDQGATTEDMPGSSAPRHIRVAVAGESGNLSEYWQKRAETYEERYHRELVRHAQAREELGAWRGRAEQAQELISKLLPANAGSQPSEEQVTEAMTAPGVPSVETPSEVVAENAASAQHQGEPTTVWMYATVALLSVMAVAVVAALAYLISTR